MRITTRIVKGLKPISDSQRLVFERASVKEQEFCNRSYVQLCAVESKFVDCRFENLLVKDASFGAGKHPSTFERCSFNNSKLRFGAVGMARLVDCSFQNVTLEHFECIAVDLVRCKFSGTIRKGYIFGVVFDAFHKKLYGDKLGPHQIEGNDFSGVRFVDFEFRHGVDLTKQILPESPEYLFIKNAGETFIEAETRVLCEVMESDLRRELLLLIRIYRERAEEGQKQLLLREDDFGSMDHKARSLFFKILRSAAAKRK